MKLANLGPAFSGVFRVPDALRIMVVQGLFLLLPVVGYVALLGWQREVFERARREDDALPPPELTGYLARGFAPFQAMVTLALVPLLPVLLGVLVLSSMHLRPSGYLPPEILQPLYTFVLVVSYPAVLRASLAGERRMPVFSPIHLVRTAARAPQTYAIVTLGVFAALLVTSIGFQMCCVGAIVTAPLGHAVAARIVASWQREIEASEQATVGPYR